MLQRNFILMVHILAKTSYFVVLRNPRSYEIGNIVKYSREQSTKTVQILKRWAWALGSDKMINKGDKKGKVKGLS